MLQSNFELNVLNTHTHPRNPYEDGDGRSDCFIPYYQSVYSEVIGIGNTTTALTTPELALSMKRRWNALSPQTIIHVAGLMTESTSPEDVVRGYDQPFANQAWIAMKVFIRSVSNSHGADVDNVAAIIPCVKAMTYTKWQHRSQKPMVLKMHLERKFTPLGRRIPVADRERISVMRDLEYILEQVPEAWIEVCHVSDGETIEAIRFLRSKGFNVFGEIAPHYSNHSHDDLFEDGKGGTGLNSHKFCLPVFKSAKDMRIILDAMTSGEPFWHFGNDEACHDDNPMLEKGVKTNRAGITLGGQTQIPEAVVSYVIEKFAEAGRTEHLQAFLAGNAQRLYGLGAHSRPVLFKREEWVIPSDISMEFPDKTISCKVAMGGQTRQYRVAQ